MSPPESAKRAGSAADGTGAEPVAVRAPGPRRPHGSEATDRVAAIRHFNRFYTQRIGVLTPSLLGTDFSLAEARLLYEIAHRDRPNAAELARDLGLDQGYLSRIFGGLENQGLVQRTRSETDSRRRDLELTDAGRRALEKLDRSAAGQIATMLVRVPESAQVRLLDAMRSIEAIFTSRPGDVLAWVLRPHGPGDLGWIVERHGSIYARERGWDERFEGLVAQVVAAFAESGDPSREQCWIAQRGAERIGSVLLASKSKSVAQLRLLLVEPSARGQGVGTRLVDECVRFARRAAYRKIVLWTEGGLDGARRIYEGAGFAKTEESRERKFGADFVSQMWELTL